MRHLRSHGHLIIQIPWKAGDTQETSDDRYRNCEELMQALERAGKPPKKAVHRLFSAIYRA